MYYFIFGSIPSMVFNRTNNDPSVKPDFWIKQVTLTVLFGIFGCFISIIIIFFIIKREFKSISKKKNSPNKIENEINVELWSDMTKSKSELEEYSSSNETASSSEDEILLLADLQTQLDKAVQL
jgi:hypothetical protein